MEYSIDQKTKFKINVLLDKDPNADINPNREFFGLGLLVTNGLITEDLQLTEIGERAYLRKMKEILGKEEMEL